MDTEHTPLLACPFCGSPGLLTSMDRRHFVQCTNDGCAAEPCGAASIDGVVAIWNRRAPVHSVNLLPELVEALREARPHVAHSTISVAGAVGRRSATEIAATIDALLKATS
jgi:hypothetical protein